MGRSFPVAVAVAIAVAAAADASAADCPKALKELTAGRKRSGTVRTKLRKLLLAEGTSPERTAEIEKLQTQLATLDTKVDELQAAAKGCRPAPKKRRAKAKRKKKPEAPKAAARRYSEAPPAVKPPAPLQAMPPSPPATVRVVLSPDPLHPRGADRCGDAAYRARIPRLDREGRVARTPHAFASWSKRQQRHDAARRAGERIRELLVRCRNHGDGR